MTTTESAPAIVPDFGEDAEPRKMCFICSKGTLDMAYPALVMANAALGEGIETHLFFTFWGMDIINKETMGKLKFTILGNPATHMPQGLGGLPGMTGMATKRMKKQIEDLEIPDVPEFLQMIVDAGAQLWACQMSYDMMDLKREDLYEEVIDVISATDFVELSEGGQVIFI